jgi:hypothetical protein
MTASQITLVALFVLVVAGMVVTGVLLTRRTGLRKRFGPEYDRTVFESESRTVAERELRARERRHDELQLRPLDDATRDRFAQRWRVVQAQFVTDPEGAVVAGDDLINSLAKARGYPTTGYEDQLAYLSVEHARTLGHYREAHEIYLRGQQGKASTEELRQALVHYRELVADMLDEQPSAIVDAAPRRYDT